MARNTAPKISAWLSKILFSFAFLTSFSLLSQILLRVKKNKHDLHDSSSIFFRHNHWLKISFPGPDFFTIENQTWHTPVHLVFLPVHNATVTRNGLVYNYSHVFTFNKWYFEKEVPSTPALPDEKSGVFFSFVQIWQDKFQHLAFDTFPRAAYLCGFLSHLHEIKIVIVNNLQLEIFQLGCDLPSSRFVFVKNGFSANIIYIDDFRQNLINVTSKHGPVGKKARDFGWNRLLFPMGILPINSLSPVGLRKEPGSRVVYLRRTSGSRMVRNEHEVIQLLRERFGAELLEVSPVNDWKRDRESFSRARIVIGPHGGAFANMIFAPPRTTIVEFLPLAGLKSKGENERPCYLGLAKALGFEYHALEFDGFNFDEFMTVPLQQLQIILTKL